jgi:hypothetical protein
MKRTLATASLALVFGLIGGVGGVFAAVKYVPPAAMELRGPVGAVGPAGPVGAVGPAGAIGARGPQGKIGLGLDPTSLAECPPDHRFWIFATAAPSSHYEWDMYQVEVCAVRWADYPED